MYGDERAQVSAKDYELKEWARKNQCEASTPGIGARGGVAFGSARTPIRLRIEQALQDANGAVRRAEAANRARNIIEQHPEFAELLDALNEF